MPPRLGIRGSSNPNPRVARAAGFRAYPPGLSPFGNRVVWWRQHVCERSCNCRREGPRGLPERTFAGPFQSSNFGDLGHKKILRQFVLRRTAFPPSWLPLSGRIPLSRCPPCQGLAGWLGHSGPVLDAGSNVAQLCCEFESYSCDCHSEAAWVTSANHLTIEPMKSHTSPFAGLT